MNTAAKWPRRLEIALIVAGISFLGWGFAASFQRWDYQMRQERAMLRDAEVGARAHGMDAPVTVHKLGALEPSRGSFVSDPLVLGRIEIPRIGIRAIVREGDDDTTLALAVGHVPGTARPGENGNTVLAGHRDSFFRELRDIRLNDEILFVIPPRSYLYRVVTTRVVAPNEMSVLDSSGIEELTLVTCHPFNYVGSAPNRFIVHAARVIEGSWPAAFGSEPPSPGEDHLDE